jgi:hypothetical protein
MNSPAVSKVCQTRFFLLSNYLYLTNKLTEMLDENQRQSLLESIKAGLIITWKHINFHGEYDFSAEKMQDSVGLNLLQILTWKAE